MTTTDEIKKKLLEICKEHKIKSSHLDDLVTDALEARASGINNEGIDSQIDFLIEEYGSATESVLNDLIDGIGAESDEEG